MSFMGRSAPDVADVSQNPGMLGKIGSALMSKPQSSIEAAALQTMNQILTEINLKLKTEIHGKTFAIEQALKAADAAVELNKPTSTKDQRTVALTILTNNSALATNIVGNSINRKVEQIKGIIAVTEQYMATIAELRKGTDGVATPESIEHLRRYIRQNLDECKAIQVSVLDDFDRIMKLDQSSQDAARVFPELKTWSSNRYAELALKSDFGLPRDSVPATPAVKLRMLLQFAAYVESHKFELVEGIVQLSGKLKKLQTVVDENGKESDIMSGVQERVKKRSEQLTKLVASVEALETEEHFKELIEGKTNDDAELRVIFLKAKANKDAFEGIEHQYHNILNAYRTWLAEVKAAGVNLEEHDISIPPPPKKTAAEEVLDSTKPEADRATAAPAATTTPAPPPPAAAATPSGTVAERKIVGSVAELKSIEAKIKKGSSSTLASAASDIMNLLASANTAYERIGRHMLSLSRRDADLVPSADDMEAIRAMGGFFGTVSDVDFRLRRLKEVYGKASTTTT
jgi:hypothetical protein